jgi:hypothetical protein
VLAAVAAPLLLTTASAPAAGTAPATFATSPSASVSIGGKIHDSAVLIGAALGPTPTGTITFRLYGPNDPTCSGPVAATYGPLSASQTTISPDFSPTASGTYYWVADYSGDNTYAPQTSACGQETVQVTDVTPKITTMASPGVQAGSGTIHDTATLTGGMSPTGTVEFVLFAPDDPTCASKTVPFISTVPVGDPSSVVSGSFTPTVAGTYHWEAMYSGDTHNGAVTSGCSDANESVTVTPAPTPPATSPGGSAPGSTVTLAPSGTAPSSSCDPVATAKSILSGLSAVLTGQSAGFTTSCSAGLRIVLRAREIRPGNRGYPRHDGYTTMTNILTHIAPNGPALNFTLNANGVALRNYAEAHHESLVAFLVIHVRPDKDTVSTEELQILTLG